MDVDTVDLFVAKEETLSSVEDEFGPSFFILLRNFDLNGSQLRPDHVDILRERVTPYIQRPVGFAEIYAMTDRSGDRQLNYRVSGARLIATQQALRGFGAPLEKVQHGFAKAVGEDFFEDRHAREPGETTFSDSLKKSGLRIVVIALSPAPIGVPTRIFRSRAAADTLAFCRRHVQIPG